MAETELGSRIVILHTSSFKEHLTGKKNVFFRALSKLPPPPPSPGQVVQLFLDVKNDVLARITKPSNND